MSVRSNSEVELADADFRFAPTTDISARIKEAALTCPRPDDAYAVGRAIVCLRFTENNRTPSKSLKPKSNHSWLQ
jgi:hypothetical protein